MISDCHAAPVVPQGCPVGGMFRNGTYFPNEGKYCAECAMPCIPVCDFVAVSNSPEISTGSITDTNVLAEDLVPWKSGIKLHIPASSAFDVWLKSAAGQAMIDGMVDSIAEAMKKALADLVPAGVQYSYDTDTKKVLAS
jgi:hypothetical protein